MNISNSLSPFRRVSVKDHQNHQIMHREAFFPFESPLVLGINNASDCVFSSDTEAEYVDLRSMLLLLIGPHYNMSYANKKGADPLAQYDQRFGCSLPRQCCCYLDPIYTLGSRLLYQHFKTIAAEYAGLAHTWPHTPKTNLLVPCLIIEG